jgi:hypothetical protein
VARVALLRDGEVEDELAVGGAQDADETQSAFVAAEDGWSEPSRDGGSFFRALASGGAGRVRFALWFLYPQSRYEVEVTYRSSGEAPTAALGRLGTPSDPVRLEPASDWTTRRLELPRDDEAVAPRAATAELSRWRGASGLVMEAVRMLDEDGREQAVFEVHRPLSVVVELSATEDGSFPLIPAALVFRLDGIVVTRHVADETVVGLKAGERVEARLDLDGLQLGNGTYLLSVGLYRLLDVENTQHSEYYDYFDRSFEFSVAGNPPLHNEVFRHPGTWTVRRRAERKTLAGR